MSRCSNCGRESPRGASFCLSCGTRLDPVGPMHAPGGRVGVASPVAGATSSTPARPAGLPGPILCPICGGENQAGMNFCRLCGSSLAAPFDAAVGRANSQPAVLPQGPALHAPVGRANGQPQGPMQGAPPPPASRLTPAPAERGAAPEMHTCHRCGGTTQSGFAFCQHCGAMLPRAPASARGGQSSPVEPARDAAPIAGGARLAPVPVPVPVRLPTPVPVSAPAPRPIDDRPWGVLHSVRRDGTDGELRPLAGDWVEIGRSGATAADLVFDDRHLAPRHARLEQQPGGGCRVVPIDVLNGVYRRLRAPHVLPSGSHLLIGRELLYFELVEDEDLDVRPLQRHGTTMFGSPPRRPWGRLTQLLASGGHRDIRHLHGDEVVLGREEGDIVFRDDEFLSRRHAALKWQGGQCILEDLKSSNGTFIRLRGPQLLEDGDTLRMGDQMFRIELGGG